MRILVPATATLSSALALCATTALAEITAMDVWESWKAFSASSGQTLTVDSESYGGGTLTLSGLTNSMVMPEGNAAVGALGELVLTEEPDGTVSISMPEEYPFSVTSTTSEGEDITMTMVLRQTGLSLVASGEPAAIDYVLSAPRMEIALDEMRTEGEPVDFRLVAGLDDVGADYRTRGGDPQVIDSAFSARAMSVDMRIDDPVGLVMEMTLSADDLEGSSTGTLSPLAGSTELASLLRLGLSSSGTVATGPARFSLSVDDGEAPFVLSATSESGTLEMALDADGIRYGGGNRGVAGQFELPSLPLPPFELEVASTSGEIRMPLIASDTAKPFGLKLGLTGLSFGETAWAIIDPLGGLPRDPATLEIDMSGSGRWAVDIADPEALANAEASGATPGEIETATLNSLLLSLLGATLTGTGDFTFDNASVPPTPAGIVNLRLEGGNALLDTLVSAGLLPEDQAMGARMMLGLFARPGDGEDTLQSTIEIKEDGAVLANGQRIR